MKSAGAIKDPTSQWLARADLSRFRGKYVAIVGRRVAASGTDIKKVHAEATRKHPGKEVALWKVPKEDILIF